ncbi:glycosyltransferase [Actinoplanes sp. NEAU-A12]|uniref:Glycosyltransferase n=1 Tax=Actinoplanes sandaracinus TaxID=3045177 RepID=A0ABT6WDY3_9ACTN|nr:glycosyltransferase [Actinoplanes sandaracinus]MDI6097941.1 glycosyltransferase [Actinoplanes sandaracinus]
MIAWSVLAPLLVLTAHTVVNALLLRRPRRDVSTAERVAVLLPLRNEAGRVTPCLRSLLAQRGVPDMTIHVLDDASTDDTAAVVRALAAEPGGERARLLSGTPPEQGWLGKPNACRQLADDAGDADVLVFVDADVVLEPDAIAGAVTLLREAGVTLLSPYPKIVGAGRLVQPLLQWSWLTFLPMRGMERSARPSLAAAGGQWLVLDRAGYRRAGGHAAVRADVLEDIGLARAVKRSGGRIALADGSRLATCHMYASWPELANGYGKSLWASFGSAAGAAAVVGLLLLLYAVPVLFLVSPWPAVALVAYLLGVTGRLVSAAATGGRAVPDAFAHPVSVILFAWLVARSFHMRRHHRLTWRGRPV